MNPNFSDFHQYLGYAVLASIVIILLSFVRPGRALISLVAKLIIKAIAFVVMLLASFFHKFGAAILQAHVTFFRNFFPRNSVMPTVSTTTTKRT